MRHRYMVMIYRTLINHSNLCLQTFANLHGILLLWVGEDLLIIVINVTSLILTSCIVHNNIHGDKAW